MSDPLDVRRNGEPADIENLWAPYPAFLVGGGPSINDVDKERFRERGVMSMGINQVASWVPVRAWVHSDPQHKFHHAMFLDPSIMTFTPQPKLRYSFFMKTEEGFRSSVPKVKDCPNTYGFRRDTCFMPDQFFTTPFAHWGPGKHQPKCYKQIGTFCTMLIGIRLLYHLGVRTIFLLGVDYCGRDKMCYGFPSDKRERNRRYKKERAMLEALLPTFERHGVLIYNTNRESQLDLFKHVPFDQAVDFCKGDIPPEPLDPRGYYAKSKTEPEAKAHPQLMPKHFH
jgi:hypothetical protein